MPLSKPPLVTMLAAGATEEAAASATTANNFLTSDDNGPLVRQAVPDCSKTLVFFIFFPCRYFQTHVAYTLHLKEDLWGSATMAKGRLFAPRLRFFAGARPRFLFRRRRIGLRDEKSGY